MKYISIFLLFLSVIVFESCSKKEGELAEGEKKEAGEEHAEENKNQVEITENQFKTVGIQLGKIENRNLKGALKANGILHVPAQNMASVSSFIGGVIKDIRVIPGDFVTKGQTLALLEHPDIVKLQQDYLEAQSDFVYAEKEYNRQKELYEQKIVAGKKFQEAEANYRAQRALLSSLENQLSQLGIAPRNVSSGSMARSISIKSPIDGYVSNIKVNTGTFVDPAVEIFSVVDNRYVHVDLQVYETDLSKVKEGQKVYFSLANAPNTQYEATIFSLEKSLENETKSITVHAEIKNNKDFKLTSGMYVNGRIQTSNESVLALPNEAIVSEGELKYIFIQSPEDPHEHEGEHEKHDEVTEEKEHKDHDEKTEKEEHKGHDHGEKEEHEGDIKFTRIEVRTGVSDMGYTEIIPLSDLPKDALFVIKGAYYLAAQMKKDQGGGEAGHGH